MKISILMITHNRPQYARLSISRLCDTVPENARITIWDNGSQMETLEVIKSMESHKAIENVIYCKTNEKLTKPTNWFWENNRDADFISKVDDDCLMPAKWCEALTQAHSYIPEAGILGCWRFLPEDFDYEKASKKIFSYGPHMIMRNCWIEGSGYLMKREVLDELKGLRDGETFTDFCIGAASLGYVNGWYYPFLYQEHMDDPRAEHTGMKTEDDFHRLAPLSAKSFGIKNRHQWTERLKKSARKLQEYSIDPDDFTGRRARIIKKVYSLIGKDYFPKVRPQHQ